MFKRQNLLPLVSERQTGRHATPLGKGKKKLLSTSRDWKSDIVKGLELTQMIFPTHYVKVRIVETQEVSVDGHPS